MKLRISVTSSVVALGAVAAATLAPIAPAMADTVIPLRDVSQSIKVGAGTVTVTVKGQKARLSPGMVALPTTRNAWVSGAISVKVNSPDADGGSIEAGYVVGCQVDVGSAAVTAGVEGTLPGRDVTDGPYGASVSGSTGGTLSLAAGAIGTQALTVDRATWPKPGDEIKPDGGWAEPSTSFNFKGASGSFSYADQTIGVDGCAGYAQARLYVVAAAQVGNSEGTVIAWGPTFTLG